MQEWEEGEPLTTDIEKTSATPATSGKRAWITGAGKGIGRAVALGLARRGWTVAASARTEEDLIELAREAQPLVGDIRAYPLDVTDAGAVAQAQNDIETNMGSLDLAILNAGSYERFGARNFSADRFRKQIDLNLMGTVYCLEALMPGFIERGRGHLAVVSSLAGYRGLPNAAAYGATKAALINMCEALKPDLDRAGVKLSVINPGFVKTPLTDKNEFPMPFLVSVETAAERIIRGLETGRFEITFPRRFACILKVLRLAPYGLYFHLTRKMT